MLLEIGRSMNIFNNLQNASVQFTITRNKVFEGKKSNVI